MCDEDVSVYSKRRLQLVIQNNPHLRQASHLPDGRSSEQLPDSSNWGRLNGVFPSTFDNKYIMIVNKIILLLVFLQLRGVNFSWAKNFSIQINSTLFIEFFTIRVSVGLSDRSKVTQNKSTNS